MIVVNKQCSSSGWGQNKLDVLLAIPFFCTSVAIIITLILQVIGALAKIEELFLPPWLIFVYSLLAEISVIPFIIHKPARPVFTMLTVQHLALVNFFASVIILVAINGDRDMLHQGLNGLAVVLFGINFFVVSFIKEKRNRFWVHNQLIPAPPGLRKRVQSMVTPDSTGVIMPGLILIIGILMIFPWIVYLWHQFYVEAECIAKQIPVIEMRCLSIGEQVDYVVMIVVYVLGFAFIPILAAFYLAARLMNRRDKRLAEESSAGEVRSE